MLLGVEKLRTKPTPEGRSWIGAALLEVIDGEKAVCTLQFSTNRLAFDLLLLVLRSVRVAQLLCGLRCYL